MRPNTKTQLLQTNMGSSAHARKQAGGQSSKQASKRESRQASERANKREKKIKTMHTRTARQLLLLSSRIVLVWGLAVGHPH